MDYFLQGTAQREQLIVDGQQTAWADITIWVVWHCLTDSLGETMISCHVQVGWKLKRIVVTEYDCPSRSFVLEFVLEKGELELGH